MNFREYPLPKLCNPKISTSGAVPHGHVTKQQCELSGSTGLVQVKQGSPLPSGSSSAFILRTSVHRTSGRSALHCS